MALGHVNSCPVCVQLSVCVYLNFTTDKWPQLKKQKKQQTKTKQPNPTQRKPLQHFVVYTWRTFFGRIYTCIYIFIWVYIYIFMCLQNKMLPKYCSVTCFSSLSNVCGYPPLSGIVGLHLLFECLPIISLDIIPQFSMLILLSVFAIINIQLIDILIHIVHLFNYFLWINSQRWDF